MVPSSLPSPLRTTDEAHVDVACLVPALSRLRILLRLQMTNLVYTTICLHVCAQNNGMTQTRKVENSPNRLLYLFVVQFICCQCNLDVTRILRVDCLLHMLNEVSHTLQFGVGSLLALTMWAFRVHPRPNLDSATVCALTLC
jgi:hypothetical protein